MSDHIFSASVKSRIAAAEESLRKAEDAYARLENKDSAYAMEIQRLITLHDAVVRLWQRALERAK